MSYMLPEEEAEWESKKMDWDNKSSKSNLTCYSLDQGHEKMDQIGKYGANLAVGSPKATGQIKITENVIANPLLDRKKMDPITKPVGNSSAKQLTLPSPKRPSNSQLQTTSALTTIPASPATTKTNDTRNFSSVTNHGSRSTRSNSLESSSGPLKPHTGGDGRWDAIHLVNAKGTIGLSNFRLLKRLGYGDIGSVYLVELRGTNAYFAMKVMDKASLASRNKLLRAATEREILALLDHPFLPTLYSYFETDKFYCLVMEFCSGGNLHSLRQKQPNKYFTEDAAR